MISYLELIRTFLNVSHLYGNDHIHLLNFNQDPVKKELTGDMVQFTYTAKSGRKLIFTQEYNKQAPSIYHHNNLPGDDTYTIQNKLDHLVSSLSYQRSLDAEQSSVSSSGERTDNWDPVYHFDSYIKRAV